MRCLAVHPSPLMYTKIFLRLEPLGLELVAAAVRAAGHAVQIIDLQVESHTRYDQLLRSWKPDLVLFSVNYLANVPEVVDLAKATRHVLHQSLIVVGGHSASFVAKDILEHGAGCIDCVLKGEGESGIVRLLDALQDDKGTLDNVPGAVTLRGEGPPPGFVKSLNDLHPARDLLRYRHKYFLGTLDPCASIEFSRGCPWDCAFCSAWTFYGRSYRIIDPDKAVDELAALKERGVFIVDDVAFIHEKHGLQIGEAIARRGIKKKYYLETRGDVLLRNKDLFRFWRELGMEYLFLGVEAIDNEGLQMYRKRVSLNKNYEALEFARSLGINVAINLIADPEWDEARFAVVRDWCREIPEIVNISINTPYPGTESWLNETRQLTTLDYRLFDIQHAVLPTTLSLPDFYREVVATQRVLFEKHMGWSGLRDTAKIIAGHLVRGQSNFIRSLWKFDKVYDPRLQLADHARPVRYRMSPPPSREQGTSAETLYVHRNNGRRARSYDDAVEHFVDQTRSTSEV